MKNFQKLTKEELKSINADRNNLKSIEVTTNKRRVENVLIYENLGFGLTHNKFTIYK